MTDITSDLDTAITEEELAAYSVMRQAFAANFFRRQIAKYEQHLGSSAITAFTRWWNSRVDSFRLFTESQREFDGQAFEACDRWLERWVKQQVKTIATGKIETPSSPDQEVSRIRASWGISNSDAKNISKVIRQGVKKSIPFRLRKTTWAWDSLLEKRAYQGTQKEDDAIQTAWVTLLTKSRGSKIDGRDAHIAGINAGRDNGREDAKLMPISQMGNDGPDEPEVTLDGVRKFLTEDEDAKTDEGKVEAIQAALQDSVRRTILCQFKGERPDDYAFIVDYFSRVERDVKFRGGHMISVPKRGAKTTPEERKRAHDILKRLRKWEMLELAA